MLTVFFALPFAVGFGLADVAGSLGAPWPQAFSLGCVVVGAGEGPPFFVWIQAADPTTETTRDMSDNCRDKERLLTRLGSGDHFYWGRRFYGARKRPTQGMARAVLDGHITKVSWRIGKLDLPSRTRVRE